MLRCFIFLLLASFLLTGCVGTGVPITGASLVTPSAAAVESSPMDDCPMTEAVWAKPPEDAAVLNAPEYGYYFVNEDRSIWASAGWTGQAGYALHAGEDGNKEGWFRPEGAKLEITGRRIDGQAAPLEADVPCCYPTRFQATGLYFPTPGCWEVTAKAADRALTFVVAVEP